MKMTPMYAFKIMGDAFRHHYFGINVSNNFSHANQDVWNVNHQSFVVDVCDVYK